MCGQPNPSQHRFVADSPWKDEAVVARVTELVLPILRRQAPISVWIVDDTGWRQAAILVRDSPDPRLDALFVTMPISWKGTLAQYVGRPHRDRAGKRDVVVYDYIDAEVPVLVRMAKKRQSGIAPWVIG
jgi:hypothetical protein